MLQPGSAGVLKEIDAGIDRGITEGRIEPVELDAGLLADSGLGVACDGRDEEGTSGQDSASSQQGNGAWRETLPWLRK